MPHSVYKKLVEASRRHVKVIFIYGKNRLNKKDRIYLRSIKNIEVYFLKELNAKCYFNETTMLITSMNLIEYSEKNNHEMGVAIDSVFDEEIFQAAVSEFETIKAKAKLHFKLKIIDLLDEDILSISTEHNNEGRFDDSVPVVSSGVCMHCKNPLQIGSQRPICEKCFSTNVSKSISEKPKSQN